MSDNSTTPGEHPEFPPAPPADPYTAPAAYSPPPAQSYSAPQQYPAVPPQYPAAPQQAAQPYPGAQPYGAQQYPTAAPYAAARPSSGLAITSLVTGIAGIVFSWTFVALLASIAAVITGHMALKQTRSNPALGGRGMAIAGLILGYVGVAILAFTVVIGIFSFLFIGGIGFLPFFLS